MTAKAQPGPQRRGFDAIHTVAPPGPSQISEIRHESSESTAVSYEPLWNGDAAWLFEHAPDGMVLADAHGRIAIVNAQVEEMFGYRREELVGQPTEVLMPARVRDGYIQHRSEYSAGRRAGDMGSALELYGRRKDGSEFPIEINLSPLKTDEGTLVLSAIRGVCDLKRAQELRSRLEFESVMSRLSKTFIHLPADRIDSEINNGLKEVGEVLDLDRVAIILTELKENRGTVTHWWVRAGIPPAPVGNINERFPWLADRVVAGDIVCVSAPEDLPAEAVAERKHMLSTGMKSWLTIPLQVGGERLGRMGTTMFRRQQVWDSLLIARFQQAAEIFANAVARKHTSQLLREQQEQIRLALDAAKVGVWGWRIGGDEIWASEKTRELFAWPPNLKLDYATFLKAVHPADRENAQQLVERVIHEAGDYGTEFRILLPDGSERWIKSLGRSNSDADGAPERVMGASVDITDRKYEEEELTKQLAFETLLAELSAKLVNIPVNEVGGQIEEAQKRICEALDLDRSTLAQVLPDGGGAVITHSWAREGFQPSPHLSQQDLPWLARTVIGGGQRVSFARLDDLPEEAANDKELMLRYGPKSSAIFPLSTGEKVIGALAFGSLREEREWSAPLVERLGLVAEIFANALARARADENLRDAYREIEQLKSRFEKENVYLREEVKLEHHHREVIGDSAGIRRVLKSAEQVAGTDATVLLLGETGTGKELIARTIHDTSRRKSRIMVKVNCAALPASLVESELFGREKGAFTGALSQEIGRFELANGSTILLDEIAELPLELQSKLLRILQEGEFQRLGNPRTIKVDVRVVAATSRNLQEAVRAGKFREDLFYRLNVFPITIPPLRERREDIPELVWHFVNELSHRMGRSIESIQASTMEAFKTYHWPGNIRELHNVIERFLITSTNAVFGGDLRIFENPAAGALTEKSEDVERNHILHVLEMVGWRVRGAGGAAEILGLKPTTLESRMQKLGITRRK
jgi:formate hydrogenlyase transcriptional activator